MPSPHPERGLIARGLFFIVRSVLTVLIVLDEVARPLYRPLARWLAGLRIVARMEAAIARMPRALILLTLAIPFAIAEPLKIVGFVLMARDQVLAGLLVLGFAYLASFLIVERIYHAGRDKLLSYGWLAWSMGIIVRLREQALGWVRSSAAYALAMQARDAARRWWRSLRAG